MDLLEDGYKSASLNTTSSAFFSTNQSPKSDNPCLKMDSPKKKDSTNLDSESLTSIRFGSTDVYNSALSSYSFHPSKDKGKRVNRSPEISPQPPPFTSSNNRSRSYDVYIGFHGRKPLLLRFANWLRSELEVQGLSCFVTDRARCRNSRKHRIVERAMDASSFGVVVLAKKSFRNPYTIEELRFFSGKKNLVPVYFDVGPADCHVRDITEKQGEVWGGKHGGELWLHYGGIEKEWREAVAALSFSDEWKLEASGGKWRDCILRAVTLLALRLGRRSIVDRLSKWREKAEREEFPYTRNENFVGRKKEISEIEFMLFGDVCGDSEKDYFDLKTRPEKTDEKQSSKSKGKEPIIWKESEKEIEMNNSTEQPLKYRSNGSRRRRRRSNRVIYGKGIACISGEPGIGKTELLLEFAYRFHQRYKMVLWIGGESKYIRQNYLNLWSFLEIDVGVESSSSEKGRTKSFEEQEESAIARVRKELMRDIPFLVIIDNLESEKDWFDHKLVMDLLPRFGGETHVIISTRLSRVMNIEPLKLSFLSGIEAVSLMHGGVKDQSITEIDALRAIEEKLGRLTLGLAIVGAILSELPINPSRLLDTVNRMPLRDITWSGRENHYLRRNNFLLQLFEVCFSIFDHADESLATRMVLASGWFAPAAVPTSILALAAHGIPEKHHHRRLWRKIMYSLTCGFTSNYARKSEEEASSLLLRFNIARGCTKQGYIRFNELVSLYARKRGVLGISHSTVRAVFYRGSVAHDPDHMWAACFHLFGFGKDPILVNLKVTELLFVAKEVVLPLAVKTFMTFSRCGAAMELLRLCTEALEAADQTFVTPVEKWLDRSLCWKPVQTNAQLNPCLWQELALTRASVLEVRAKLMARGGLFDIGDDLIRKAIFIRTSICGVDHPETISALETLSKLTRLNAASVQNHTSP
ncbi:hypothetical protein ACP275_05G107200 [Erythranthe tilingii]